MAALCLWRPPSSQCPAGLSRRHMVLFTLISAPRGVSGQLPSESYILKSHVVVALSDLPRASRRSSPACPGPCSPLPSTPSHGRESRRAVPRGAVALQRQQTQGREGCHREPPSATGSPACCLRRPRRVPWLGSACAWKGFLYAAPVSQEHLPRFCPDLLAVFQSPFCLSHSSLREQAHRTKSIAAHIFSVVNFP